MSEIPNICSHCGGQKVLYYQIEPVYSNGYTSGRLSVSSSSMRLCTCPIEREKHDGKLSSQEGSAVCYHNAYGGRNGIRIAGRYADGYHDDVILMPDEALSLLAWLKQEQGTLERLVEEQEYDN